MSVFLRPVGAALITTGPYRDGIEPIRIALGRVHGDVLYTLHNLAVAAEERGDQDEADVLFDAGFAADRAWRIGTRS